MNINLIDVEHKDRDVEISKLKMVINLIGIPISYTTTDLLTSTLTEYDTLRDDFSIKDAALLLKEWENKWTAYYNKNNSNE